MAARGFAANYSDGFHRTQARFWKADDLSGHMALVKQQVDQSLADPETILLARRLVSGSYDVVEEARTGRRIPVVRAWDQHYWAPDFKSICQSRDDACELALIWTFLVQNVRYVYDPDFADTFATLKISLEARSGDCDDSVIAFCALARAIGFVGCIGRVVSMGGDQWEHTFPLIGCPKENPTTWIPFDMTVHGVAPGWHVDVPPGGAVADFDMANP